MKYISTKQILNKTKSLEWFGAEYSLNLYRGCCHGCIYCDSRSICYQDYEFDIVKPKKNAIQLLENELRRKRKKGVIDTGGMNDPYNPFEKELCITRDFLRLVKDYNFGVSITTKSSLIERDIDLLCQISDKAPVICEITITSGSDALSRLIEPNVAPSSRRFEAIKKLTDNGIYAGIVMMPILPFIEDNKENIISIIDQANYAGAKFIYPYFGVTLRQNQREWYLDKLNLLFPNRNFEQLYRTTYADNYECLSLNKKELTDIFETKCKNYNILYDMNEIISEYKSKYDFVQLSLFEF